MFYIPLMDNLSKELIDEMNLVDNIPTESDSESEYDSDSSSGSVSSDEVDRQQFNINLKGLALNGYYIIDEIGRGGTSIVWMAYHIDKEKFYAIKVNPPSDFREGVDEAKFHQRLPSNYKNKDILFNKIIESFPKTINNKRYFCSVYRLYCGNLDDFISKGYYPNGYDEDTCINMIYNVVRALDVLHNKLHVFHGDIKPDNILLAGHNYMIKKVINDYMNHELFKTIKQIKIKDDRLRIHQEIINSLTIDDELRFECDDNVIDNPKTVLSDFGSFCDIDDDFEDEFGTRYYMAPEIMMRAPCEYPVDIWALGCTFYELVTGKYLFNPKKKDFDTNHQHLTKIQDYCGTIPKKLVKSCANKKIYFNKEYKLKNYKSDRSDLNEILVNEIESEEIIDFIKKCLNVNPKHRATVKQLLNHSIFNRISSIPQEKP